MKEDVTELKEEVSDIKQIMVSEKSVPYHNYVTSVSRAEYKYVPKVY